MVREEPAEVVRVGECVGNLAGVFLFRAEDGIRDLTVTGVQTCALPISSCAHLQPQRVGQTFDMGEAGKLKLRRRLVHIAGCRHNGALEAQLGGFLEARHHVSGRRSEERRVGKECRSRWSPDRYKKKKNK